MQQHVTVTCGTYNSAYGLSDYICNWFLIVMRPFGRRTRTPGPGLFERTARTTRSAPWQTMASSARPSSTRGTYLAWYIERTRRSTRTQPSPLSTTSEFKLPSRPSVGAPRAVRSHLGRRRRRCVSVLVDSPKVEVGPKHGAPRPKLPSAGSGPSGPFNE